jgi:hypothetical protein
MKKSLGGWDSRYYTFGVGRGVSPTNALFPKRSQVENAYPTHHEPVAQITSWANS